MSQRIQVWSFFILVLATMTSCELQEVDLVELKKVEVERIENEEMFMDVTAVLDNPNSFNIKVKDSDFDLYMENKYIGKANLENTFILESGMQKGLLSSLHIRLDIQGFHITQHDPHQHPKDSDE